MDMGLIVIIAIVVLIVGIFLGFLLSKATTGSSEKANNLKNQMDSLQERFTSYQSEVADHFNTTTTLANKMSQDYQEMQVHLAHSVEALVADEELRAKLLMSVQAPVIAIDYTPEAPAENADASTPIAYSDIPRDYAPKSPGEVGTLAEEFGTKHHK